MSLINWSDFDRAGTQFQIFCNDLLSFEFGKRYVPFSAPGKDKGKDGLFEGLYNGKSGKWRFQAKFHHPDTGRTNGVNQLIRDVKSDIENNVSDETELIFITNVELNPNRRNEILNIALEALAEKKKPVKFDIWDGAKIDTLLAHHLILKLWYTENTKYIIQEYSELFKEQLDAEIDTALDFSNKFYFREEKLVELKSFLDDDNKKIAIINGEAGIGKTRLCIEFFKKHIGLNNNWMALVVITHNIDLGLLQKALTGSRDYLVLIDDADKFDERVLTDLITIIKNIKPNKVKLLLTVRNYLYDRIVKSINVYDKAQVSTDIRLQKLSPEETAEFIRGELPNYNNHEYLPHFVELTRGVPIMIMTLLKMFKAPSPLSYLRKDLFLSDYIERYFNEFESSISKEHDISKRKIGQLIELVSLIEPIEVGNEALIEKIASTEEISIDDVQIVLQQMAARNILLGNGLYEIKPDLYSDSILEKAIEKTGWLKGKLSLYGDRHMSNIIKNVGYSYQFDRENPVLDGLLRDYIQRIDTNDDLQVLSNILDAVYTLVYLKPALALAASQKVLRIYQEAHHPLHSKFQSATKSKNYFVEPIITKLRWITQALFQQSDYSEDAFKISERIFRIIKDEKIITELATFNKSDSFDGFQCKRQNQILSYCRSILENGDDEAKLFALKAIESLLKLQYFHVESHPFKQMSMNITTIYVQETETVRGLRMGFIHLLIDFYKKEESNKTLRDLVLKLLIDIPREIRSTSRRDYKGKQEIKAVLVFLDSISSQDFLELKDRHFIKDQLYWYKEWGVDKSNYEIIDRIVSNLKESSLSERLLALLDPITLGESEDRGEKHKSLLEEISLNSTGKDLADALIHIIEQRSNPPDFFYQFLDILSRDLDKTTNFLIHLWTENRDFVVKYCSNLLRTLRFAQETETFYWDYINRVKSLGTKDSINCVFQIYNYLSLTKYVRRGSLELKDATIMIELQNEAPIENYFSLASALPSLYFFNESIASIQIRKFFEKCDDRHLDTFCFVVNIVNEFDFPQIRNLIFENTVHLSISYEVERFLNSVLKDGGFDMVLNYVKDRFNYYRDSSNSNSVSARGYRIVPIHNGSTLLDGVIIPQKVELFERFLKWFVEIQFSTYDHFFGGGMVEFFRDTDSIDTEIAKVYNQLIDENSTSYNHLFNISYSLSRFEVKNEDFIDLIIKILKIGHQNFNHDDQNEELRFECYRAITTVGVKSGKSGQPYEVDVKMRDLLDKVLRSEKVNVSHIKMFFTDLRNRFQRDIDDATDDEGGASW